MAAWAESSSTTSEAILYCLLVGDVVNEVPPPLAAASSHCEAVAAPRRPWEPEAANEYFSERLHRLQRLRCAQLRVEQKVQRHADPIASVPAEAGVFASDDGSEESEGDRDVEVWVDVETVKPEQCVSGTTSSCAANLDSTSHNDISSFVRAGLVKRAPVRAAANPTTLSAAAAAKSLW